MGSREQISKIYRFMDTGSIVYLCMKYSVIENDLLLEYVAHNKAWAQLRLGVAYEQGYLGLVIDKSKALRLLQLAVDQGLFQRRMRSGI